MRSFRKRLPTPFFFLLAAALPLLAEGRAQRVTFLADDGVSIAGTLYEPAARPAPAVILVHMLARSRKDWEPVAQRLAEEGIAALAIDLRGHGESGQGPAVAAEGETVERLRLAGMTADVRAARRFLDTRPELVHDGVGLAGASLGASLVALVAAEDPAVRSIALLSPSLDYRGVRIEAAMRKYQRPALLVASREDPYAWRSMRELAKDAGARELILLEGAGHGTTMLARDASLSRTLVDWFRRTLL